MWELWGSDRGPQSPHMLAVRQNGQLSRSSAESRETFCCTQNRSNHCLEGTKGHPKSSFISRFPFIDTQGHTNTNPFLVSFNPLVKTRSDTRRLSISSSQLAWYGSGIRPARWPRSISSLPPNLPVGLCGQYA